QFKRSANDLIILKADLKAIGEAKGENDKAYKEKFAEYEQLRDQYIKLRVAVEKLDHQIQRVERLDPNREMLSYKDDPRYKQECIVYKNLCECWEKIRLGELNTLQDVHGYLSNIYQAQLPEVENMVQLEKDLIQEDAVIVTLDNI